MKTADKNPVFADTQNSKRNPAYNKNTDKNHNPDSRTFNEDEESWRNRQAAHNNPYKNEWYADTLAVQSADYRYDDEHRGAADYIDCDHSEYNRNNSRFGWHEPEE